MRAAERILKERREGKLSAAYELGSISLLLRCDLVCATVTLFNLQFILISLVISIAYNLFIICPIQKRKIVHMSNSNL